MSLPITGNERVDRMLRELGILANLMLLASQMKAQPMAIREDIISKLRALAEMPAEGGLRG